MPLSTNYRTFLLLCVRRKLNGLSFPKKNTVDLQKGNRAKKMKHSKYAVFTKKELSLLSRRHTLSQLHQKCSQTLKLT